jgi:hypothetical protein
MDKQEKESILQQYYYKLKHPSAFSGPQKLHKLLEKKYQNVFTLHFIKKWLKNQDSYSLSQEPRYKFRTARVLVSSIDEQYDADLTSVENLKKYNDGVRFLLFVIDIFSRYLWVKPLYDKTAKSILQSIKEIFAERKPFKLRTDKGSEFNNRFLKKYLKESNVYYFTTQNTPKANYVERVQKTIKVKLYRMMRQKRSYRFVDDLQKIVDNYNASPHRSLNNVAPKDVNKQNEADLFAYMYLRKPKKYQGRILFQLKKGDLVRISHIKHPFRRSYQEQFTREVFKINHRQYKDGLPMYSLQDLNNQPISGLFYSSELQKVEKDENSLWFIDKILKRRKRAGKLEYYVSWDGFPSSFNSWVLSEEVKET